MTGGSLRLFVAASLPDEHLAWVEEQVAAIRGAWPEARWIPFRNQHVTLKFLGSTHPDVVAEIVSACGGVAAGHRSGRIGLTHLGVFPSRKRARVLWIGLEDPEGLLASLAAECDRHLARLGFERETVPTLRI